MVITYNLKDTCDDYILFVGWPLAPYILYKIVDFEIIKEVIGIAGVHIIIPNKF